jgi:hypothetical protein
VITRTRLPNLRFQFQGKNGTELEDAFRRLEIRRGVQVLRADTATARSLEYNAGKIEEAIHVAVHTIKKPYGLLGYSQGCANALMSESMLLSGSPEQQHLLSKNGGLVCRQLLFSASNGSLHGPAMDRKVQSLISMASFTFANPNCSVNPSNFSFAIQTGRRLF